MTQPQLIYNMLSIIYPVFYTLHNSTGEELVFLDCGKRISVPDTYTLEDYIGQDKTQCEAVENHFHLFGRVKDSDKQHIVEIGKKVSENLLKALTERYPLKKFVVYLTVNLKDSTIIRFHQIWEGEPLYYDDSNANEKNVILFKYSNQ